MKPFEKLYVYEIEGEVDAPREDFGDGFLGCWREEGYSYFFYSLDSKDAVAELLAGRGACRIISETVMDYDQWEPADALEPFKVGPLSIVPAWLANGSPGEDELLIDPGVVFGAGTHYTTRACLEIMLDLWQNEKIRRVIDLGTGSGILAIAAARMGASRIIAVDNNNLAVETAARNAVLNGFEKVIDCLLGDAGDFLEMEADLVLANLHLPVLESIFGRERNYCGRWYIVSGILGSEAETFRRIVQNLPLKIVRHEIENFWNTFLLKGPD